VRTAEREQPRLSAPDEDERPRRRGPADLVHGAAAALRRGRDRLVGRDEPFTSLRSPAGAFALFAVAALAYPVHQLLTRGQLLLSGEMWAEMATNYYATAQNPSLLERLFAPDAGYIPLPQRLIALAGSTLGLQPDAVPHLYSWAALLLAAVLIASVCLPVFRPVIASDGLRFALALALVLFPDYETRTFINVTYFAVVPLVMVTALAAVRRSDEVPAWAWALPVFVLSKPGVLAVLPAMLLVSLVSRPRFRRIALVSAVLGAVQAVRLAVSSSSGTSLLQQSDESALTKAAAGIKYALGFTGRLLVGPGTTLGTYAWMFTGMGALIAFAVAAYYLRSRATPLVGIGLSLILFTMLVNTFTFSAVFGQDMAMLAYPGFDRRFVVAVIGALFVVAGLIAMLIESPRLAPPSGRIGRLPWPRVTAVSTTALFGFWFLAAGWVPYASAVNRPFGVPIGDVSQWQQMSSVLASGEPVVCVPLDPFSWVYGRDCQLLVNDTGIPFYYGWTEASTDGANGGLDLTVPQQVQESRLASVAVLVRPEAGTTTVAGRAIVTDADGEQTVLAAEAEIPPGGGLMQFVTSPTPLIEDVRSVELVFDRTADVAALDVADPSTTLVLWMGQPGAGD
jgi:hypothetical protein